MKVRTVEAAGIHRALGYSGKMKGISFSDNITKEDIFKYHTFMVSLTMEFSYVVFFLTFHIN